MNGTHTTPTEWRPETGGCVHVTGEFRRRKVFRRCRTVGTRLGAWVSVESRGDPRDGALKTEKTDTEVPRGTPTPGSRTGQDPGSSHLPGVKESRQRGRSVRDEQGVINPRVVPEREGGETRPGPEVSCRLVGPDRRDSHATDPFLAPPLTEKGSHLEEGKRTVTVGS